MRKVHERRREATCVCTCHSSGIKHPTPPCCLTHLACQTTRIPLDRYREHVLRCPKKPRFIVLEDR